LCSLFGPWDYGRTTCVSWWFCRPRRSPLLPLLHENGWLTSDVIHHIFSRKGVAKEGGDGRRERREGGGWMDGWREGGRKVMDTKRW